MELGFRAFIKSFKVISEKEYTKDSNQFVVPPLGGFF